MASPAGFVDMTDKVARAWLKLTYDTPLSDVPVFGVKSSLNPLGGFYRKRYKLGDSGLDEGLPMPPLDGPPLPRKLKITWPWR